MKTKKKAPIIRIKGFNDDWEQRKLGDYSEIIAGGTPNTSHSEYWNPKEIPWMSSGEINNKVIYATDNMISKIGLSKSSAKWVKEKSVLIALAGQGKTRGTVAITEIPLTTNQSIAAIQPSDSLYYKFLFQNLEGRYEELRSISSGDGTRGGLNKQILSDLIILAPTISEQRKIGDFLCTLDHLITLHQRGINRIVCLRKAMVEKMFPQNGADVPAVRFGRYKEPWRLCQFSEIFTERHIIDTISDEYPQLAFTIEEGVIRPEDKKTNKRDFLIIDKATKKYLQTEYDDIIYNPANVIYGAIHRNALGKGCVSPIYKIFYTDQDSTFMECIVRHPNFIKEISRSMEGTVKKLRTLKPKAFLEMSAYIAPTIEEQKQIGEYFRQMDWLIEIEKEELEKIKHIKSACLEKMFV